MRLATLLTLLLLTAVPRCLLADNKFSVESPEAMQAVLENATSELLEEKKLESLEAVAPASNIGEVTATFKKVRDAIRERQGDYIDSRFVGVSKRGSLLRQFNFLGRYQGGVIVISWMTVERKGRWYLTGYHFTPDTTPLLAQATPAAADKNGEADRLAEKIMKALAKGAFDAPDVIAKSLARRDRETAEKEYAENTRRMIGYLMMCGGVVKCERLEAKELPGTLANVSYFVECEQGGLFITLTLYHSGDEWKLDNVQCRPLDNDSFAASRLELDSALAVPHTAKAAKPADGEKSETR